MNDNTLTVTQLNLYIKNTMEADFLLSNVWVKGEISNFKLHSSGHIYLTLKDETGVLKSVMFRAYASRLNFVPENGMKVLAHGRISVYERDGQYQLYIDGMQPDGTGALYLAYEQMKKRLEEEGLFDQSLKKTIPKYPGKIAVITSPTGAAVRDIINVLSRRYKLADITLYPVLVQGEGASNQIAKAIEYVNAKTESDVIIVGRGGGSIEDLWAFNEEITARAIFNSIVPVISAVGHETDFTISDFVADLRAPTPSAAAELATPSTEEVLQLIENYKTRLNISVRAELNNKRNRVEYLKKRISVNSILNLYNQKRIYIDSLTKQAENTVKLKLSKCRNELSSYAAKMEAMSPLSVLARGYGVIEYNDKTVKSVNDLSAGDIIDIKLVDGNINAQVTQKEVL